jgi:hypothetical protein
MPSYQGSELHADIDSALRIWYNYLNMKFFVPQTEVSEYETAYQGILRSVKDQMRMPITDRRIYSINYVHDKKKFRAKVGDLDPQQGRYEVVAILESKPHVIFTRAENGDPGLTMLVNSDEITEIEDFGQ